MRKSSARSLEIKLNIMEKNKEKTTDKENVSDSPLERGKKMIAADEEINKKDPAKPEVKKEKEKDAEQWHNEG